MLISLQTSQSLRSKVSPSQRSCANHQVRKRKRLEMRNKVSIRFGLSRPRQLDFLLHQLKRDRLHERLRQAIWTIILTWLSMKMSQVSKLKWQA
jgi:hypothetical protein